MPKKQKPRYCSVRGCPGDRDLTKTYVRLNPLPGEPHLSFFRIPAIISRYNPRYCGKKGTGVMLEKMIELSTVRRNLWLKAIGMENDPGEKIVKICAQHFVSGRPADLEDETNPDWVPTLKLVPEENPLGKAKFLIKKLVQKQRDTSFRLKYGLSSEEDTEVPKEETNETKTPSGHGSSSAVLSDTEGMEEVLIRQEPTKKSRTKKIKEIFIRGEPKIESAAKRKMDLLQEEPKTESTAKRKKDLTPQESKNESIAKRKKEDLIPEEPNNESAPEEIKEVFVRGEPKNESNTNVPSASVELPTEKKKDFENKGEIFLDDEATNSNITNYMLKHSDEKTGHWHLRFCKNENCTVKKENDTEITKVEQAQTSEPKGHYHLRLCTCTSCVLSKSVDDKLYSLEGTEK